MFIFTDSARLAPEGESPIRPYVGLSQRPMGEINLIACTTLNTYDDSARLTFEGESPIRPYVELPQRPMGEINLIACTTLNRYDGSPPLNSSEWSDDCYD